jgi:hypothetical protein
VVSSDIVNFAVRINCFGVKSLFVKNGADSAH